MKKTTLRLLSFVCTLLIAGTLVFLSQNSNKVYAETGIKVTYDGNGATSGDAPVDSNTYNAGNDISVETIGTLSKTGYIFTGWNTMADGTGTNYTPGNSIGVTGTMSDITLYATWAQFIAVEPTKDNDYKLVVDDTYSKSNGYTVYYDWYKEGEEPSLATTEYTGEISFPSSLVLSNANYYCKLEVFYGGGLYTPSHSVAITPKEIKFDRNGGPYGDDPETIYQLEGREITMPDNPYYKDDYHALGWNTDQNATTAMSFTEGKYTVGSGNVTFYAIWEKIIKTEPSAGNNYTVIVGDGVSGETYQWYRGEMKWFTSSVYYRNNGNGNGSNVNGTAPLNEDFYLKPNSNVTSLRFKYSGAANITNCTVSADGYYYPPYNSTEGRYDVTAENTNGGFITNIEVYDLEFTPIADQTNAKLNLAEYPDDGYYCKVELPDGEESSSAVFKPSIISADPTPDASVNYQVVNTSVTGTNHSLLKPISLFLMIGVAGVVLKRKKH